MVPTISATQLLRNDHKIIRGLFHQFQNMDERAPEMKAGVINETRMMLEIHFQLEENLLYPALIDLLSESAKEVIDQCRTSHSLVRRYLAKFVTLHGDEERFNAWFEEMMEMVEDHLRLEEEYLFPSVESTPSENLEKLGERMQAYRTRLMQSPRYKNMVPRRVQSPHGGEQKRKL